MKRTSSAAAATAWLRRPAASRKRRARGLSGTMPRPVSFETAIQGPRGAARAAARREVSGSGSAPARRRLVSQRVRQSMRTGWPSGACGEGGGEVEGGLGGDPAGGAAGAVAGDAGGHLVVERLGRGDVAPGRGVALR